MNFSKLKSEAIRYLSYKNIACTEELDALIEKDLRELSKTSSFRFTYSEYTERLDFLKKEPYMSFLGRADRYYLVACTLGTEVERNLKRLFVTDMSHAVVYDACANAYLEYLENERKKEISNDLSYTFCPGYGKSKLEDIKIILSELKAERIGITLTEGCLMIPQKSIAGVAAKGVLPQMECGECVKKDNCVFRKEGKRCFQSGKS